MTERTNTFAGPDVQKLFAGFAIPGFDAEAAVAVQRKTIEALGAANTRAYEGFQAYAVRQTEMWQEAMTESAKGLKDLAAARDAKDAAQKQAKLTQAALEKGFGNARELGELAFRTQIEVADLLGRRFIESFEDVAKNGPKRKQ